MIGTVWSYGPRVGLYFIDLYLIGNITDVFAGIDIQPHVTAGGVEGVGWLAKGTRDRGVAAQQRCVDPVAVGQHIHDGRLVFFDDRQPSALVTVELRPIMISSIFRLVWSCTIPM